MKEFVLNNGIKIPAVGVGVFRVEDANIAYETVKLALSVGYRHIDTAMIYGNEEAVGKAIRDSGVPRQDIFLTTKLWNADQRSGQIQEAINASLKHLDTDYVDLYLVHWPVKETYVSVWNEMEHIYKQGKAQAIGVSNYNPHHLDDLLRHANIVPAVNQIECYPYLTQEDVVSYCKTKKIYPQAWGPLGAGKSDVLSNPVILELAKKYDKTPAQIVLRWNHERGVIVIPKSVRRERLIENLSITDFQLSAEDVSRISALNKNQRLGSDPETFDF
ncbi:aldo/keto reductase [Dysgonomonas macrotermitis]|uniref:Aldo/keto reductase n=1 Tax=Dysgonomonas macrotermitis TaxID=1346286 RepID=A0A1M5FP28_9BACT|nr:aldo/keto reductase [Dysgonomonas macrotermitis]SHF92911.1 Aldo/keto reductase [Dysgonomonas macrotermitis]